MKKIDNTILNKKIQTVKEAKTFIDELKNCDKLFHFDDPIGEIECFTPWEAYKVEFRLTEMFKIQASEWGEYDDPYGYANYILYK